MARRDPLGLVGTTIAEKYAIETVVGEGGFAIVYKATHILWKRPVAVKVFKALSDVADADRERLLEEFVREGALLAELSERSAAIVQARDVGTVTIGGKEKIPYMVLEWLEGATLEEVLEKERAAKTPPRSVEEMMKLLEPAAIALALAHSKGIAHRDVKPANVFVLGSARGHDTSVKLLDFGIAKVVQDVQKVGGAFSKTAGNVTSFTPLYGAPEQFNRQYGSTGPWTDVFSLAIVATELLTNHEGLEGDDIVQLAFSSANPTRRPTPRTYGANVSDAVERVFARAVAVKTDERYATAGEFWNALRDALGMSAMAAGRTSSLPNLPEAGVANTQPAHLVGNSGARISHPGLSGTGPGLSGTGPGLSGTGPGLSGTGPGLSGTGPGLYGTGPGTGPRISVTGSGLTNMSGPGAPAADLKMTGGGAAKSSVGLALIMGGIVVALMLGGVYAAYYFLGDGGPSTPAPAPSGSGSAGGPTGAGSGPPSASGSAPVVAAGAATCSASMVKIAGGDYFMGSDDKAATASEHPGHPIHLAPYCLDETEVTVAAYAACSDTGKCKRASRENEWKGISAAENKTFDPLCNANYAFPDGGGNVHGDHPVNCVSWDQAVAFCESRGGRLPTEAEWEFAARGSDGRTYPWGEDPPNATLLNACGKECATWETSSKLQVAMMYPDDDRFPATAPVKSFPAGKGPFGNYDMVGNVWEWVADFYADYDKASAKLPRVNNPTGPATGTDRVIRGGAFNGSVASWVRPTFRYYDAPEKKSYGIGFRCAKSL